MQNVHNVQKVSKIGVLNEKKWNWKEVLEKFRGISMSSSMMWVVGNVCVLFICAVAVTVSIRIYQLRQVEDEIKACSTSDKMRLWWLGTQITTLLTQSWAGGGSLVLKMMEPARGPERKDNRTQVDSTSPTLIAFTKDLRPSSKQVREMTNFQRICPPPPPHRCVRGSGGALLKTSQTSCLTTENYISNCWEYH